MPTSDRLEKRIDQLERELHLVRDLFFKPATERAERPDQRTRHEPGAEPARLGARSSEPEPVQSRLSCALAIAVGTLLMLASWWNGPVPPS